MNHLAGERNISSPPSSFPLSRILFSFSMLFLLFLFFFLQFHRFRVFSNVVGGGGGVSRDSVRSKRSKNDLHKPVSSLVIYFLGQLHFGCIILRRTLRRIEYSNFAIGSSSSSFLFLPLLPLGTPAEFCFINFHFHSSVSFSRKERKGKKFSFPEKLLRTRPFHDTLRNTLWYFKSLL